MPAGIASDRISRRVIYAVGLLAFALTYVGLALARSTISIWLLFALYGAYWALTDGVGRAWVSDLIPPERTGTGLGLYQSINGACVLVAGVWAGLAWHGTGRLPVIASGVAVGVLALALLAFGAAIDRSGNGSQAAGASGHP